MSERDTTGDQNDDAWNDVLAVLQPGELVEHVVFGNWGWSYVDVPEAGSYGEPDPPPVPVEMRARVLSGSEARPLMVGWSFNGGFGAPSCYAVRIWTNHRVFWVTQYDGSTSLSSAPRSPVDELPDMPGGG